MIFITKIKKYYHIGRKSKVFLMQWTIRSCLSSNGKMEYQRIFVQ